MQAVARENKFLEYWTKPGGTFTLGGNWGVDFEFLTEKFFWAHMGPHNDVIRPHMT